MILKYLTFFVFSLLFTSSAYSSVWSEEVNENFKRDVGLYGLSAERSFLSSPFYLPDLNYSLTELDLNKSHNGLSTYKSLKSQLSKFEFQSQSIKASKKLVFGYEDNSNNVFGERNRCTSDCLYFGVNTSLIYKDISYGLNLIRAQDKYLIDDSYFSVVGDAATFTIGNQYRHWGPGEITSLLWSESAKSAFGLHIQSSQLKSLEEPWFRWLGDVSLQGFAGKLDANIAAVDDLNLFAGRLEVNPLDGFTSAVSVLDLSNSVFSRTAYGLDVQKKLFARSAGYGQFAVIQDDEDFAVNTMVGLRKQFYSTNPSKLSSVFIEVINVERDLMEGISDIALGNEAQKLGSFLGSKGSALSIGGSFSDKQKKYSLYPVFTYAKWEDLDNAETFAASALNSLQINDSSVEALSFKLKAVIYPASTLEVTPVIVVNNYLSGVENAATRFSGSVTFRYWLE